MKAAVFRKPYTQLKIEEWEKPAPAPNEALIKVAACGVCHTDLHFIDHGTKPRKEPPLILGHEITGIVEEVGDEVTSFSKGERVMVSVIIPCNKCEWCERGRTNICRNRVIPGNSIHGGYAEYVTLPATGIIPLPDDLPLKQSAVITDAFGAPYHALQNIGKVSSRDVVAVFGCGGIGAAAIQIAKQVGAFVIAMDMNPLKLEWAESMGADETVNTNGIEDLGMHIRKMSGGGVDILVEAIGAPRTVHQGLTCLGPAGQLLMIGYTRNDIRLPAPKIVHEERSIHGIIGCPVNSYPKIIEHIRSGAYHLESIVTKEYPLDEIEPALNSVRSGQALRTIIVP